VLLTKLHRNFSFIGKTEDTNIISVMLNLTVGQCQRYSVELDISHFGFDVTARGKVIVIGVVLNLTMKVILEA